VLTYGSQIWMERFPPSDVASLQSCVDLSPPSVCSFLPLFFSLSIFFVSSNFFLKFSITNQKQNDLYLLVYLFGLALGPFFPVLFPQILLGAAYSGVGFGFGFCTPRTTNTPGERAREREGQVAATITWIPSRPWIHFLPPSFCLDFYFQLLSPSFFSFCFFSFTTCLICVPIPFSS